MRRSVSVFLKSLVLCLSLASWTGAANAESAAEIDAKANEAIQRLYSESAAAKELGAKASGILVFPDITKAGVILGGEYGEGVLRVAAISEGYYSSASGSIGLQVGISSRSLVIMFMTDAALAKFKNSSGWEAGVDADVTVVEAGATGSLDTTTSPSPVIAFNFGESGLMAGVSLEGTKIDKINR